MTERMHPCALLTCDPMSHRESGWLRHTKVVSSSSRMIMKHLGVQSAILSVTAPGACVARSAEGQATLARKLNDYAAALRDEDHAHLGFFASLPDVLNTSYAIAEIEYGTRYAAGGRRRPFHR